MSRQELNELPLESPSHSAPFLPRRQASPPPHPEPFVEANHDAKLRWLGQWNLPV